MAREDRCHTGRADGGGWGGWGCERGWGSPPCPIPGAGPRLATGWYANRTRVAKGYWTAATVADPSLYPSVPLASGNRLDLWTSVKYAGKYAGALPDRPMNQNWADWNTSANRGWIARAFWRAHDSYFQTNCVP